MALSDSNTLKKTPSVRRREVDAFTNKRWSDSQKIEAVTTYLTLGNLAQTAKVLQIPDITLRGWKTTMWWKELEDDIKVQEELTLSSRLKRIIESTMAVTEDRLANGDFIFDQKTGKLIRKPVSMRDAHKVSVDMIERRDKILNRQPNSIPMEQIENKLEKLAKKFEEIATGRRPLEVTDVIIGTEVITIEDKVIDNAIPDEWEEELQEGGQLGQEPSGPGTGS